MLTVFAFLGRPQIRIFLTKVFVRLACFSARFSMNRSTAARERAYCFVKRINSLLEDSLEVCRMCPD